MTKMFKCWTQWNVMFFLKETSIYNWNGMHFVLFAHSENQSYYFASKYFKEIRNLREWLIGK